MGTQYVQDGGALNLITHSLATSAVETSMQPSSGREDIGVSLRMEYAGEPLRSDEAGSGLFFFPTHLAYNMDLSLEVEGPSVLQGADNSHKELPARQAGLKEKLANIPEQLVPQPQDLRE